MTNLYAASLRFYRTAAWAVLLLTLAWPGCGRADEATDFRAALAGATMQYRVAMNTLEHSSQEQTAAEVRQFRAAWQSVIDQASANRPAAYASKEEFFAMLMQVDTSIVGALLVIDLGNRDAARNALAPIEEFLMRMQDGATPPTR